MGVVGIDAQALRKDMDTREEAIKDFSLLTSLAPYPFLFFFVHNIIIKPLYLKQGGGP